MRAVIILTSYLALFCIRSSTSKPHSRKQKRTVEVVSRRLLEEEEERNIFSENELMKRRFREMLESLPENIKVKAMREFLDMFDMPEPAIEAAISKPLGEVKKPPQYMVDLYNTIADRNGITRAPGLLDADTVRSIPNMDETCPRTCRFDLRPVDSRETLLDAELHVYQDRPKFLDRFAKPGSYFIRIYKILSPRYPSGEMRKTLVAARRLPSHVYGWQIFPLLTTVERWNAGGSENLGITIETTSKRGRVITSRSYSKWKQPILVLFSNNSENVINHSQKSKTLELLSRSRMTEDAPSSSQPSLELARSRRSTEKPKKSGGKGGRKLEKNENKHVKETPTVNDKAKTSKVNKTYEESWETYKYGDDLLEPTTWDYDYVADGGAKSDAHSGPNPSFSASTSRFPSFSTLSTESSASRSCRRYPLYVDFEEMGWSGWIIHPQGYNAYHCRGKCAFPLGQNLKPSNHATVQSIMHTLGLGGQPVDMPCCTPDQLYDINLLYFDHNDYVVLRRYKDMVAASCACR